MKRKIQLSEGHRMFITVMIIFAVYAIIFIIFEDYDRTYLEPFNEISDWHLLIFSLVVILLLGLLLRRYAKRMDERINKEQDEKNNQLRREMTQNISHELKTPVASILGFTDTIIANPDMEENTRQQFIVRTNSQAKRLASLLNDISMINSMDYGASNMKMEDTDVSKIVDDVVAETALAVEQKKMKLINNLPQDIVIEANPSLIHSIFRNLVDNAVNYAGEGSVIEINAHEEHDGYHFVFADNGCGVEPEHLNRIFERFYRVHKGRSRALGGTGLGLAIAKHAVMLHGGNIVANNAPAGGLTFDFDLKKSQSHNSNQ